MSVIQATHLILLFALLFVYTSEMILNMNHIM